MQPLPFSVLTPFGSSPATGSPRTGSSGHDQSGGVGNTALRSLPRAPSVWSLSVSDRKRQLLGPTVCPLPSQSRGPMPFCILRFVLISHMVAQVTSFEMLHRSCLAFPRFACRRAQQTWESSTANLKLNPRRCHFGTRPLLGLGASHGSGLLQGVPGSMAPLHNSKLTVTVTSPWSPAPHGRRQA